MPVNLTGINPPAILITVSPDQPNWVYAAGTNGKLHRSTDAGQTWEYRSFINSNSLFSFGLEASPTDAETIFHGKIDVERSYDGGLNFTQISDYNAWPAPNYSHADHRGFAFSPSGHVIYDVNDGGLFQSTDNGNSWSDLSQGMEIMQVYHFANSEQNPNFIVAGAQDNGINSINNGSFTQVYSADGMDAVIDPNNPLIAYASIQFGNIFMKTSDGGLTWNQIPNVGQGDWNPPFAMDVNYLDHLYFGTQDLNLSTNGGGNWLSIGSFPEVINDIELFVPDANYICLTLGGALSYPVPQTSVQRTTDGGQTWTDISAGLPILQAFPNSVAVHQNNPDIIWVTFSGFQAGQKVFQSTNGGANWNNISGSLPNIPCNDILHLGGPLDELVVASDLGVWYRNDTLSDWIVYGSGLPNVIVTDLAINRATQKLRVATYGRGLWEVDLLNPIGVNITELPSDAINLYPNPTKGIFNLQSEMEKAWHFSIYDVQGKQVYQGQTQEAGTNLLQLSLHLLSEGTYYLRIVDESDAVLTKVLGIRR